MKKQIQYMLFQLIAFTLIAVPFYKASAQQTGEVFRSERFKLAIDEIVDHSRGKYDRGEIIDYLINLVPNNPHYNPGGILSDDFLILSPEIDLVAYDGLESAMFNVNSSPTITDTTFTLNFTNTAGWVKTSLTTINYTSRKIFIPVQPNNGPLARSTSFVANLEIGNVVDSITFTAYIVQEPMPQKLILVTPEFLSVAPQGGATDTFTITYFNFADWEAIIPVTWISIADSTHNGSPDDITFTISPNPGTASREAIVIIRETGYAAVSDTIHIYQSASYIVLNPREKVVACEGDTFDVQLTKYGVTGVTVSKPDWINPPEVLETSITITVQKNNSPDSRAGYVVVKSTGNPMIRDSIFVAQYSCSQPYILLSPQEQTANWNETSLNTPFALISNNIGNLQVSDDAGWLTASFNAGMDSVLVSFTENESTEIREAFIKVFDGADPAIYDSVKVIQEGKETYILIDPSFQSVSYEGNSVIFNVLTLNVDAWEVENNLPGWISISGVTGNSAEFAVDPNNASAARQFAIYIRDVANHQVFDSAIIYQEGTPAPYLFISPREQRVSHSGNDHLDFQVTAINVENWVADVGSNSWISVNPSGQNLLSLAVSQNSTPETRVAQIKIYDGLHPDIYDSVFVYQYSALDTFLLAAPRMQKVTHTGNQNLVFNITTANVENWEVETVTLPDWITVAQTTLSQLSLIVDPNEILSSRQAMVKLFVTGHPDIDDSVFVYQYSALDTFLLAAPREQKVIHTGNESLVFNITAVNVDAWEVESGSLPDWITVAGTTLSQLTLVVDSNDILSSRQAMVRIFVTGHQDIYDSVYVYQFSALDTFLLAEPREQRVAHTGNQNLVFDVTSINVNAWEVDTNTLPGWITVAGTTLTQMTLAVDTNEILSSRQAVVRIFVTGHPGIYDSVNVYQYSALDTFLLASPREQRVAHTGTGNLNFEVTAVNVENWEVEANSLPGWITVAGTTPSQMTLVVDTNNFLNSRQGTVRIFVSGHPGFYDSVKVFQYSALDTLLLASPREQRVAHTGTGNLAFAITTVNVEAWEVETGSLPGWITVAGTTPSQMILAIDTNELITSRQVMVRIFVTGHPGFYDSVFVYQYSALDTFLLAAPREQRVPHTGNENLVFDVNAVNVEDWEIETSTLPEWISVVGSTLSQFALAIDTNDFLSSRQAMIRINVTGQQDNYDSVYVYQYSALDTFLLASPREQIVQFTGSIIDYQITSVNVPGWVVNTGLLPAWIELGANNDDTLQLNVLANTTLQSRNALVYLYDPANPRTYDSVLVYQLAAEDPNILLSPREKKVAHEGNTAVDFEVTLVNVDEWEFADTTIYQEWIDFQNLGNKMRLSVEPNNLLEARSANIVIQSTVNQLVRDSVDIYQYSGLDQYILMEPREQLAKRYSGDTLYFKVTKVNVEELDFEVVSDPAGMIDPDQTNVANDTLSVFVNLNTSPESRQALIKVFDIDHPDEVSDTVSVYQNFPYIILRPSAVDSLDWTGIVRRIDTYSNVGQYLVSKGEQVAWYQISKDSTDWSSQSLILAGNDHLFLRVDTNNNSYLRRSSVLRFEISDEIATEFWFDQNTRPGKFFPVSGKVFIGNDPLQPLAGVSVVLYDSIVLTNDHGTYEHNLVPENWIGTITPLIDTALAIPYYFLPPRIEITGLGITDTTEVTPSFAAYKIEPAVTLTPESTAICFGQTLLPGDPGYPNASITDTYGSSTYLWTADPPDSLLAINPNILTPDFKPKVTTIYKLEVNNFFRTAVDYFTIVVNQLPQSFGFDGDLTVCKNQAGVIYQVPDPQPGVYYQWELETGNPGGVFANSPFPLKVSGNIAIVNWGDSPGNYKLQLVAFNEFGCPAAPVSKNIEITGTEAPFPTSVLRKDNDNLLYCSDSLAKSYQWGWFRKNAAGELYQEYIIPDKTDWYCRLPENHIFNPVAYYYFVIAYYDENSCGSRSFLNAPVSVDELSDDDFTIFPNPGNGIFTIRFGNNELIGNGVIEVYRYSGQMIYHRKLTAIKNDETVDLSHTGAVDAGTYLLIVRTPGNIFSAKIVIQ